MQIWMLCSNGNKHRNVYYLEIPEICKPIFYGRLCLYVCRSDPHFISRCSMREKSINYLIFTHIWSLPNQNKSFISIQTLSYFFRRFTLLITSSPYNRCCFGSKFFQKSKDSIQGVRYYWKVISYYQNLQKQPSTGAQKAFKWWWALRDASSREFEKNI